MKGYWKDHADTARVLDDHGYHTGDFGFQNDEGFFYVQGRKDNLLKVGGHRINPREIEDAIIASGLVIETLVLGIPDRFLGQKLMAVATPKHGTCEFRDILLYCARILPKYKLPAEIKLVRALPKSSSGKIDRNRCKELVMS